MTMTENSVDCLNALLRGEIAATETYQQAIAKVDGTSPSDNLRIIHVEHREAANILREHVHKCGGKPDQGSGTWGAWAKLVEGTATIFGNTATLKALKEGEEHGVKDYEAALKDDSLPLECKTFIRGDLLPRTRRHIATLDRMIDSK